MRHKVAGRHLSRPTEQRWALYRNQVTALLDHEKINDGDKKEIVSVLSEYMYRDALVVSREINFIACCIDLMGVFGCKKISF